MAKLPTCGEYLVAIENPQLIKAPQLQGGNPKVLRNGKVVHYTGGFCVVFPYETQNQKYALRCWHASISNAQERTRLIAEELKRQNLPYFVGFEYVQNGIATAAGVQPIVVMDWVDGKPLKTYIEEHLSSPNDLMALANKFLAMVKDLHHHNLSHGDLQHGNMLVKDNGDIILVDYDSMYVPALDGYEEDVKGLKGYQHEARWKNKYVTSKADYFSELIIYTSIVALAKMPALWKDLNMEDTDWMLFTEEDIKNPERAVIFNILATDKDLQVYAERIKEFIRLSSIDELLPLEEAIIPPRTMSEEISEKWGNNGYPKRPEKPDSSTIIDKWKNQPKQQTKTKKPDTESISKKW